MSSDNLQNFVGHSGKKESDPVESDPVRTYHQKMEEEAIYDLQLRLRSIPEKYVQYLTPKLVKEEFEAIWAVRPENEVEKKLWGCIRVVMHYTMNERTSDSALPQVRYKFRGYYPNGSRKWILRTWNELEARRFVKALLDPEEHDIDPMKWGVERIDFYGTRGADLHEFAASGYYGLSGRSSE